jgi:ParB-like chromosome segregation protein Spo0J
MAAVLPQSFASVELSKLQRHPANPRIGPVDAIAESIEANGFFGALVVQSSTGYILIGNHRAEAAAREGITTLPVLWVDVDDERAMRIMLADNRIAELARWADDGLRDLLQSLSATPDGLAGTGFTPSELDRMLTADQFVPVEQTNRVDVSAAHTCPQCGYTWRDGADGAVVA